MVRERSVLCVAYAGKHQRQSRVVAAIVKKFEKRRLNPYVEGNNFRRIGRLLDVNHQSVVNWVNAYHEKMKESAAVPLSTPIIEMDELWSFVGEKKTERISQAAVDRQTHTILGWAVCERRTLEILQSVIDSSPAKDYYTDGFLMYQDLSYWGNHTMLKDKSQTYSVEGVNADLRHYLAGLQRSSRCNPDVSKP